MEEIGYLAIRLLRHIVALLILVLWLTLSIWCYPSAFSSRDYSAPMILDMIATERMCILVGWVFAFCPYLIGEEEPRRSSNQTEHEPLQ